MFIFRILSYPNIIGIIELIINVFIIVCICDFSFIVFLLNIYIPYTDQYYSIKFIVPSNEAYFLTINGIVVDTIKPSTAISIFPFIITFFSF